MRILFLFLDGIGIGNDDPTTNPLARAQMPNLTSLLGGRRLVIKSFPPSNGVSQPKLDTERATLVSLDANLGVSGLPQSATGQAALLTGRNVPAELGYHYGPKPNKEIADLIRDENLFSRMISAGKTSTFLNAYPPTYFGSIKSRRRLYSAIPLAVTSAGIRLLDESDLRNGKALSADFTAQGWRDRLGIQDIPVISAYQAGVRMVELCRETDLAFFEYWPSDYPGHQQDMEGACEMLATLDQALGGIIDAWDDREGLVLITSDHGNLEDLSTRRHTRNPVPCLVLGTAEFRELFLNSVKDLTGVMPAILRCIEVGI
jgi:2,3-bisphosphoglycerate-independent phosphoglycerate mutase